MARIAGNAVEDREIVERNAEPRHLGANVSPILAEVVKNQAALRSMRAAQRCAGNRQSVKHSRDPQILTRQQIESGAEVCPSRARRKRRNHRGDPALI